MSLRSNFSLLLCVGLVLVSLANFANANKTEGVCPADTLCPKFKDSLSKCAKARKGKACDEFVDTFLKLTPRFDCKRSFDTAPVPAVWLCDEGEVSFPKPHERAVELLSKLKGNKAREFFGSPELRSTLDGHLSEEFRVKSERAGKRK